MGLGGRCETGRFISSHLGREFQTPYDLRLHHYLTMELSSELGRVSRSVFCWIGEVSQVDGETMTEKLTSSAHAIRSWGGLV